MTRCTFIDISRYTIFPKSLRVLKFWHEMAYFETNYFICKYLYNHPKILFANLQQIKWFQITQFYNITTQSIASPRTLHLSMMPNPDLQLWPVTSKINRVHPLTMADMSAKFDEEAHNCLVFIVFTSLFPYMSIVRDLDLWPLTSHLQNQ